MRLPDEEKLRAIRKRKEEELKAIHKREMDHLARVKEQVQEKIRFQRRQSLKFLKKQDFKALKQRHLKKLTILHSNDLHGDFVAEEVDAGLVGGVSMLSGYVNKVRNEEDNVLYVIAGDMFRGSLIDSEYKGISTIEIMNLLAPDAVTLGNHEVDYGLAHLLFIEKCANFPIINANMYLKLNGTRLFNSHIILEVGGMKILFIGVLTEDVLATTRQEELIGTLVDIQDAAEEVKKITDAYKTTDIELTVLLTHIGFEEDKKLAAILDPGCGVDVIIGGHSHTYLEEPCVVAGIPIVQAAVGTGQIGRFDMMVDERSNSIESYTWELVPINEERCPRDEALEEVINRYKEMTDTKYGRILTRFPRAYTHPARNMETELGSLFAEGLRKQLGVDLALVGSGSIRSESLGPIVTLGDLTEAYPFPDTVVGIRLTGAQLRRVVAYLMRDEVFEENAHCEWFQFSRGFFCEYDRASHRILTLSVRGKEVQDEDVFKVALITYHYLGAKDFLGISPEEIEQNGLPIEMATNTGNVIEAYFASRDYIKLDGEMRMLIHHPE